MEIVTRAKGLVPNVQLFSAGLLGAIAMLVVAESNHLLFHTLVEEFAILVAALICVLGITTYRYSNNSFLLFLGNAYLFVAILDFLHMITYPGMGVLPDYDLGVSTQLHIAARYVEALSLFLATFFFRRTFRRGVAVAAYATMTATILASILWLRVFPTCFVPGQGLTAFKVASEYVVSALVVGAMLRLHLRHEELDPSTYALLLAAMGTTVLEDVSFTLYSDLYDMAHLVAHGFKVTAYYLIYQGIVSRGIKAPYKEIRKLNEGLERRVAERTTELEVTNKELEKEIRARQQAEDARSQLAAIVESSQDAIIGKTLDGIIVSWNPSAERLYGYSAEEIVGKSISILTPPDCLDELPAALDKIRRGERVERYETVRIRKGGGRIDVSVSISPIKDSTGRIVGASSIARDITERKQAEDALARIVRVTSSVVGEKFFRSLVWHLATLLRARYAFVGELVNGGTAVQTIAVWAGEGYAENFVYDLQGTPCEGVIRQQRCFYLSGIQQLFPRDSLLAKMGVQSYWGTPLRDSSGNTLGILVALSDTPMAELPYAESLLQIFGARAAAELKRKQLDEALRESKQEVVRILEILESITDPFLAVDANWRLTYLNPKAEQLLCSGRGQLIGQKLWDLHSDLVASTCIEEFHKAMVEQVAVEFEEYCPSLGMWFEVHCYPYQESISIYLRDITERKKLEEQLRRAQRLEAAGRVAAQVAHDLGNALAPLTVYPMMIKSRLPEEHPVLRYCDAMADAAERMAAINQDLLALGRRGRLEQEPTDVNLLLREVVEQMLDRPDTLSVVMDLAEDLLPISGSPVQLRRVLSNLVSNARDAMQDAGTLTISTENVYLDEPLKRYNRVEKGEYVMLSVSDDGCGIPPEIKDKIFDAFFSTKSSDERRGSGLGLSIVQSIVDDHRGYLDLVSDVGKGTTFNIYLPVSRDAPEAMTVDGLHGGSESILVVDDDPSQRKVATKLLEMLGYSVEVAANGEEALAHLEKQPADLLILDMIVPRGMDGAETYRRALELRPGQQAILMSGSNKPAGLPVALALGAAGFLLKPLTPQKLARAVRAALNRKEVPAWANV